MNRHTWEAEIGLFCFWNPKPTAHSRLKGALESLGIGDVCPPPYSVGESLKRAMTDYGRSHRKELLDGFENKTNTALEVKRHEKAEEDGYEVVAVERGKERNEYTRLFGMKVNGSERPEATFGWSSVSESEVTNSYHANRLTVSASAVGQLLVKMVKLLNGTTVREAGSCYFVPGEASADWVALCNAVEEENGTRIDFAEVKAGPGSMRMIASAITEELAKCAAGLLEEVQSGELGKRALENREREMEGYREKMKEYEGILDSPLKDVRKFLEETETALVMAKMVAAAEVG